MTEKITEEERERLSDRLKELDEAASQILKAREPYDKALASIESVQADLVAAAGVEIVGNCEGCQRLLIVGDMGHHYADGPVTCEACSPTWNDTKKEYDEAIAEGRFAEMFDDEAAGREALKHVEAVISDGKGTFPHVWTL